MVHNFHASALPNGSQFPFRYTFMVHIPCECSSIPDLQLTIVSPVAPPVTQRDAAHGLHRAISSDEAHDLFAKFFNFAVNQEEESSARRKTAAKALEDHSLEESRGSFHCHVPA